jgi:hypothetical protein
MIGGLYVALPMFLLKWLSGMLYITKHVLHLFVVAPLLIVIVCIASVETPRTLPKNVPPPWAIYAVIASVQFVSNDRVTSARDGIADPLLLCYIVLLGSIILFGMVRRSLLGWLIRSSHSGHKSRCAISVAIIINYGCMVNCGGLS